MKKIIISIILLFFLASIALATTPTFNNVRTFPANSGSSTSSLAGYCNATDTSGDFIAYEAAWYVNDSFYNSSFPFGTVTPNITVAGADTENGCDIWGNDWYVIESGLVFWKYNMSNFINLSGCHWTGDNDFLYGTSGSEVYVYDGSDLSSINNITLSGTVRSIHLEDDLLIIGTTTNLYFYNDTTLIQIQNITTPAFEVYADDNFIYITNSTTAIKIYYRTNLSYHSNITINVAPSTLDTSRGSHKFASSDTILYHCVYTTGNTAVQMYSKTTWAQTTSWSAGGCTAISEDEKNIYFGDTDAGIQTIYYRDKITDAVGTSTFSYPGSISAFATWTDDMRVYAGTSSATLFNIHNKRNMYTPGAEVNPYNITSSELHTGDRWTLECRAHDIAYTARQNSTSVVIDYVPPPTIKQANYFDSYTKEMDLLNSTNPILTITNNFPYKEISYVIGTDLNSTCFNITSNYTTIYTSALGSNTTNITITSQNLTSCYGKHIGNILINDTYFNGSTNFPISITLNQTYIDIDVGEPYIVVRPVTWTCVGTASGTGCTKTFNITNKGTGSCNNGNITTLNLTGILTLIYTPFSVAAQNSTLVTVRSSPPTGSYNSPMEFACGNSHFYDAELDFLILDAQGAGGGTSTQENKSTPVSLFYQIDPDPAEWNFVIGKGEVRAELFSLSNTGYNTITGLIVIPPSLSSSLKVEPQKFVIPAKNAQEFVMTYKRPETSGILADQFYIVFQKGSRYNESIPFKVITSDSFSRSLFEGWKTNLKKRINLGLVETTVDILVLGILITIGSIYLLKRAKII